MNTIPFTTSQSNAIRYLADVAAAQERTDATAARSSSHPHRSYIPARRRRQSRKSMRAGPPGVPADIKELVQKVLETQRAKARAEQGSVSPTETETELETEVESDAGPSMHRPRVHVVDGSEPTTPEFEIESYKKWSSIEPLVIPGKTAETLIPAHPELTPVAHDSVVEIRVTGKSPVSECQPKEDPFGLGKLVDSTWVEEEDEDDEWLSGPPSYYTSPPESPVVSSGATPACSPCPTPMFTDDEYESEIDLDLPFDPATDPIATHHLRNDLEIVRPFSPLAPEISVTPPTWEAIFEYMPQQDEAYGQLLALPGTTPLGPAELEHNTLVTRARIRRNPLSGSQECMWRGKWAPCCWACGGAAEGMDTTLPASQRTGWFVLDNQRWLMVRS
ncbi:hypothetical protein FRC09_005003 [Ceratobasidium sp. 395]|nr:hypothetical protein FRC09_005003 [Ceratobasidium sp. 395]